MLRKIEHVLHVEYCIVVIHSACEYIRQWAKNLISEGENGILAFKTSSVGFDSYFYHLMVITFLRAVIPDVACVASKSWILSGIRITR